ncbi:MAG: hypothetical protein CMQ75_01760 [Gammaproteobacteria bacterium]|nr:hypothetical protein [Gammaproteobacteria bacterium]RPG99519.1 MAG: radical SAM protein [Candidatus Pelagibacter sp. TMED118]|tara:strand:- start:1648 stop:2685 length:1038 start_codon:yes stop_codon:yes gene_type:complete
MLSDSAELVEIKQKYNKYFHINWNLTNKCNFSCAYCHPYNYEGSSPSFDLDTYKNFVARVKSYLNEDEELVISFTGGEPTALPLFDDFLTWLVEEKVQVGLTTNGSKSLKFWEKHKESFRWVSFSFHSEKTNLRHCVNVIDTLWPYTLLGVRIMMHPEQQYFDKCVEFFNILKTEPYLGQFYVEKVPIVADWLTEKERPHIYTKEQQAQIDEKIAFKRKTGNFDVSFEQYSMPIDATAVYKLADGRYKEETILDTNGLYSAKKNKFKGWKCNAGIDGLFVNELGLISGAACLPEGKDENGSIKWLGRIDKPKSFRMPAYAYTCEKTHCFCNTDLILSKFKEAVAV